MFNTGRFHRWLTIPAVVAVVAAAVTSKSLLYFLLIAPPVLALPFLAHAAIRQTDRADGVALTALRVVGYLMIAFGLMCLVWTWQFGGIMVGVAIALLVAAGTQDDERRLGMATAIAGVALCAATVVLVWIGVNPVLMVLGSAGLIAGGLVWTVEARHAPRVPELIPAMTVAA